MRSKVMLMVWIMIIAIAQISLTGAVPCLAERLKADEPITIGVPVPFASSHGQVGRKALVLAVEEINAAGGIRLGGSMHPIKLYIFDTRDHEIGVPTSDVLLAIEKVILSKKPHLSMGGPNMSEPAIAAMDLFAKYKVLHIHTIGGWSPAFHMKIAKNPERYKYVFKIMSHVGYIMKEMHAISHHIKETHKFNKMFISVTNSAHCRAAGKFFEKLSVKDGWEIVGSSIHPLGTTDFSMLMRQVRKSGAQFIFFFDSNYEAINFQNQWYDSKVPALPMGLCNSLHYPVMWEESKGKVAYFLSVVGEAGTMPDQNITPLTKHFFEAYKKRWGGEPGGPSITPSYSGPYMIKDVIERTQSLDPAKLIPAIENVDMTTPAGRLRFKNHQAIYGDDPKENLLTEYMQWQDGKRATIWPKSIANANIQLPPWIK